MFTLLVTSMGNFGFICNFGAANLPTFTYPQHPWPRVPCNGVTSREKLKKRFEKSQKAKKSFFVAVAFPSPFSIFRESGFPKNISRRRFKIFRKAFGRFVLCCSMFVCMFVSNSFQSCSAVLKPFGNVYKFVCTSREPCSDMFKPCCVVASKR